MNKLWVIARKDIREAFRSRSTYLYIALLFFLTFTYFSTYTSLIGKETNPAQINAKSLLFINSIISTLPMMYGVLICTIFAAYSVIVEKAKRNLESLMCTPVSLKKIWMAKALAVTLPSVIIALGVTLLGYIIMNIVLIIPRTGAFVIPGFPEIINAVIIVPFLIFAVVSLVIYLQLVIANPRIANLAFTGIFLLLFFGANIITQMGLDWNFSIIYLIIIALCGAVCLLLSRSLTKERVMLSSKG
jgi:ABC-2 type transport system permease protein